jgi:hypothetical protein
MTNYTDYPFTANGVKFISRIHSDSPFAKKIASLPENVFAQLNIDAVIDLVGDASLLTRDELLAELETINEGGTHAFIMLGDNDVTN